MFVAVAIGYGFEEERGRPISLALTAGQANSGLVLPGDIELGQIPAGTLIEGFRVNPRFESTMFSDKQIAATFINDPKLDQDLFFQRLKPREEISFLFSIVDTASGRELQDEPTHNLASLGKSNGERPFRLLAQPLTFLPRSSVRLQIIERSERIQGTLFIVLYGYKILGMSNCPEPLVRSLRGSPACPTETIGDPSARVIPFDYVATFELTGRPGNLLEEEVSINVEGGFVATAIGYGLAVDAQDVELAVPATGTLDLSTRSLRDFPTDALVDGIRVRPNFLRMAFRDNGSLADKLPVDLANRIFERLNRIEDVSFRYALLDTGRGRELQNQPIHNIAGLGIANGDRPFKKFARPMVFLPRSTIRITVEERFGRGRLFLVFQGYKDVRALSGGRRP